VLGYYLSVGRVRFSVGSFNTSGIGGVTTRVSGESTELSAELLAGLSACRYNLAKGGLVCNTSCILFEISRSSGEISSTKSWGQYIVDGVGLHGSRRLGLVWIMVHIIPGPNIMIITNMISPSLYSVFDGSCGIVLV